MGARPLFEQAKYYLALLEAAEKNTPSDGQQRAIRRIKATYEIFTLETIANILGVPKKRVKDLGAVEFNKAKKSGEWHDEVKLRRDSGIVSGRVPRAVLNAIVSGKKR